MPDDVERIKQNRDLSTLDVISEILNGLRFKGPVYFQPSFAAPWSARVTRHQQTTARLHLVTHGECWIGVAGTPQFIRLEAGDFAIVPGGQEHFLRDAPERKAMYDHDIPDGQRCGEGLISMRPATDVSALSCQLVCGYFTLEGIGTHPLQDWLPPILSVRKADDGPHAPLAPLLDFALAQTAGSQLGGDVMLRRLAEMLVIEAIGTWARKGPHTSGFLAACADGCVGRALQVIHEDFQRDWTVTELARHAGASRTAFAVRFSKLVGIPPMSYLAAWRLTVARRLLDEGDLSLERVAAQVGYRSSSAFNRVFRRAHGVTPGLYRRG